MSSHDCSSCESVEVRDSGCRRWCSVGDSACISVPENSACGPMPGYNARETARSVEVKNRSSETQTYVGLTRVMEKRKVWLWGGVLWDAPLELWRGNAWDPGTFAARLMNIWRVTITFYDHVAHSKRRLWLVERFDKNLPSLRRWWFSAFSGCCTQKVR